MSKKAALLAIQENEDHLRCAIEAKLIAESNFKDLIVVHSPCDLVSALKNPAIELLIDAFHYREEITYASLPVAEKRIRAYPNQKILVLTQNAGAAIVMRLLNAGCVGVLEGGSSIDRIPLAIAEIFQGRRYLEETTTGKLIQHIFAGSAKQQHQSQELTPCEMILARLFQEGKSISQIAAIRARSPKTVHTQMISAKRKLGVSANEDFRAAIEYMMEMD